MASKVSSKTSECIVFSWGANSYGQLGLGHKEDILIPSRLPLCLPNLRQITGGGGHTLLLAENGTVYSFGWNKSGQLGTSITIPELTSPQPLSGLPQNIIKVACGWNHSLALTDNGKMFVWGSNMYKQLGVVSVQKQAECPVQLQSKDFSNSNVCDISAGLRHSIALTGDGQVYTWGDSRKGQLGHGRENLDSHSQPKQVEALAHHRCTAVVAGAYHSAALKSNGTVALWGLNQHGQCGVGDKMESGFTVPAYQLNVIAGTNWISNVYLPCDIVGLPTITEVYCGWSHTIVISVHRHVYAWGRSDYGQLGYRHETSDSGQRPHVPVTCSHTPKEIPELISIKQMACGSEHSIGIGVNNEIVTFGWNEHGMCGTGDEMNVHSPHTISASIGKDEGFDSLMVGAGAGHSMVAVCRPISTPTVL